MKTITLKRLTLHNFKKIKDLSIDFSNKTQINGANGTGKTTVFDSFSWLLYGKNSHNQADFSIKTLDKNNQPISKLVHSVEAAFDVEGIERVYRRELREKWVTKRGESLEVLTGHETKFFIDDVPLSKSEFETKVKELVDESLFKMITNPDNFNNQLHWKERREILSQIAGEVSSIEILESETKKGFELVEVAYILDAGKDLDEEKKRIGAQKKKIKDERDSITPRVEEVERMKPEELNFENLEEVKSEKEEAIKELEDIIEDQNKDLEKQREEISKKKTEKFEKEEKLRELERSQKINAGNGDVVANKVLELKKERDSIALNLSDKNASIARTELTIESLEEQKNNKLNEWKEENAKRFEPLSNSCPTCKQQLPNAAETNENHEANFNRGQITSKKAIEDEGTKIANDIKTLSDGIENRKERIKELEKDLQSKKEEIEGLEKQVREPQPLEPTPEMIKLKEEINSFEIPELEEPKGIGEKKALIAAKRFDVDEIKKDLSKRDQIKKANDRINELEGQRSTLSQELAELEGIEFQIDKFNKAKIELIESRINSKFNLVSFKMFEEQLNGGEAPACECLVEGVPFKDLNTATKINAGLDVINALQSHFKILAPVFIDHKESVSSLLPMDCQVITLSVDESAPKLEILNL